MEEELTSDDLKWLTLEEWKNLYPILPADSSCKTSTFIYEQVIGNCRNINDMVALLYIFPTGSESANLVLKTMKEKYQNAEDWLQIYTENQERGFFAPSGLTGIQEFAKQMFHKQADTFEQYRKAYQRCHREYDTEHHHFYEKMVELSNLEQLFWMMEKLPQNCYHSYRLEMGEKIACRIVELVSTHDDWKKLHIYIKPKGSHQSGVYVSEELCVLAIAKMSKLAETLSQLVYTHCVTQGYQQIQSSLTVRILQSSVSFEQWLEQYHSFSENDALKETVLQKLEEGADANNFAHQYALYQLYMPGSGKKINAMLNLIKLADSYQEIIKTIKSVPSDCVSIQKLYDKLDGKQEEVTAEELVEIFINTKEEQLREKITEHLACKVETLTTWEPLMEVAKKKKNDKLISAILFNMVESALLPQEKVLLYKEFRGKEEYEKLMNKLFDGFKYDLTDFGSWMELYQGSLDLHQNEIKTYVMKYAKTYDQLCQVYKKLEEELGEEIIKRMIATCHTFDDWHHLYEDIANRWRSNDLQKMVGQLAIKEMKDCLVD